MLIFSDKLSELVEQLVSLNRAGSDSVIDGRQEIQGQQGVLISRDAPVGFEKQLAKVY
jgi:hypothetical protein